ncbi:beta-ketoadipyl CoA thiolase [Streptomyces avermitilis]|uniref:acetyl-CoA C-acyltransferase n=2 Tax=Streptomyces avermitilis TaxID=33903 RepID=Q82MQ6_STRAW|nr:thiolase family protein [Streptomyces avermitilis]MYS97232.1 acetyl-CoA C-acyltransferase [Streptomyces sp. SID5469]KUN54987.1 beta-ketoadipyl CoA thiolase [Streptomyces avermitilis]OOV25227.1 beta-ketoadipyl CoA thiolase [Streptomyces avermitilis]BAC69315.1 putative beta-ketoadipyl-CoA thiolase [Streptomyces avermitilis MA-4680 = NBRC 14893]BBJ49290.1 acetyl-CoA acetyltransferase [Streptomyces avermitilis]
MRPVHFAAARRTPIGKLRGALSVVRPDDLAATVIRGLIADLPGLDPARIDDVYWGAANQAGEDNRNVARMAALLAGLPESVPGATVNRLCASGLEAVTTAARTIAAGEADIVLAGGSESMSRAPFVLPRPDEALPHRIETVDTRLGWRLVNPAMKELHGLLSMGETAEEVAERYAVPRERQDEFALRSHRRAADARKNGYFDDELLPVTRPDGVVVADDECVREDTSYEKLSRLKPVFRQGGTVTAGNASPMNDGAAGLLLVSEEALNELGLESLGQYVAGASAGVHPDVMGIGPVPATEKALARVGWTIGDIEEAEFNEAFAAQALACVDRLGIDPELVNPTGGAIALGHPLGCSGARILTTLLHRMRRTGAARGLATMCVGVGQGSAILVERH